MCVFISFRRERIISKVEKFILQTGSLEIHTLFYSQKNISTHTKKTVLEREYGGGSMFEFRAKMTVVKKTANKRLVLL